MTWEHTHTHLLLSLVGEPLGEFVEGSGVLGLDVASASQELGQV